MSTEKKSRTVALYEWRTVEKKVGDKVKRKHRLYVHPRGWILLAALLFLLLSVTFGIVLTVRSFVRVERYTVTGDYPIDRSDEIINAAHVETGSKMFSLSRKTVKERILDKCSYLENVSVRRHMNGTLEFRVQQYTAAWCFYHIDAYFTLNTDLTVMEELSAAPKGVCVLTLPPLQRAMTGEKIELVGGKDELEKTSQILDTVLKSSVRRRITALSVASRFDISLTVDGTYHVNVGNSEKLTEKFEVLQKILLDEKMEETVGGEIDISNPEKVSVRPIYGRNED